MVDRYRDGTVPVAQVDATLAEDFEGAVPRFSELLDKAELSQALDLVWALVRRLNRFVEETKPWELAKDEADPERLDEVLYNLVEGLRVTTLLLVPYLPQTSETLLAALGEEGRGLAELGSREGGQQVERVAPLFPKIEAPAA
jgi:methionyl-tRNA synthetase